MAKPKSEPALHYMRGLARRNQVLLCLVPLGLLACVAAESMVSGHDSGECDASGECEMQGGSLGMPSVDSLLAVANSHTPAEGQAPGKNSSAVANDSKREPCRSMECMLAEKYPAIARVGGLISDVYSGRNPSCVVNKMDAFDVRCSFERPGCQVRTGGTNWGTRMFCEEVLPKEGCTVLSYGLGGEAGFEAELMSRGCRGLALDPTSSRPPKQLAAENATIKVRYEGAPSKFGAPRWWLITHNNKMWETLSPQAGLRELAGEGGHLSVLKMDCEGCEYSVADSARREDPGFFGRVGQFAFEAHVDLRFMSSEAEMAAYNDLLQMLDDHGLKLQHAHLAGCGELTGRKYVKLMEDWNMTPEELAADVRTPKVLGYPCLDELNAAGYPCELVCHNFLFARTP